MVLTTEFMSVADKAKALWMSTDKPCTEGTGTIIKGFVINRITSNLSCESRTTVKATLSSIVQVLCLTLFV